MRPAARDLRDRRHLGDEEQDPPDGQRRHFYVRTTGYLDFKNGEVTLSAISTGPFAGFSIVYDRTNTHPLVPPGKRGDVHHRLVYTPTSLDFNGGSDFGFKGGPIVALKGVEKANGDKSCVVVARRQ